MKFFLLQTNIDVNGTEHDKQTRQWNENEQKERGGLLLLWNSSGSEASNNSRRYINMKPVESFGKFDVCPPSRYGTE